MSPLLLTASRRGLARHPWQTGLAVLGVALGVAVVAAIGLANSSALAAFGLATETVAGRATHQVLAGPSGLPDDLYSRLRLAGAGAGLAPVVEAVVSLPASSDPGVPGRMLPGRTLRLLGIDPFAEPPVRPHLASLRDAGADIAGFLTRPGTALLAAETADELGLALGSEFQLRVGAHTRDLELAGALEGADELSRRALADLVVVDIATAQEITGRVGFVSRIDLIVPPGEAGTAALAKIAALLPAGAALVEVGPRARSIASLSAAFRLNLRALSLLALLCGAFLIYNTMTFSVVQRRPLLGMLRALGVSRREIFTLVLGEALAVGIAGTALGLPLGLGLARVLVRLVSRTVSDFYFAVTVARVEVSPWQLVVPAVLGLGATLLAALPPAAEATGTPPRGVMLRSLAEEKSRRSLPRLAWASVACFAAAALLLAAPEKWLIGRSVAVAFAGLFCTTLGCACLAPGATLLASRAARPLLGRAFGLLGRLAAGSIEAALSRTAVAVASLMVAVSVTVGVGLMIGSFRGALERWLERTLEADVYVSATRPGHPPPIDEALLARFVAAPGVARINTVLASWLPTPEGGTLLRALDLDARGKASFEFAQGNPAEAWPAFDRGEVVLVSEPFAYRRGLEPGMRIDLRTDAGPVGFEIGGVYVDFSSDQGAVAISRRAFDRFWQARGATALGVFVAPAADRDAVMRDLSALAASSGAELEIRATGALRAASLEVFDRTFLITGVLRLLAGLVAFIGVVAALMALELERSREMGVLRALGLEPRGIWGLVAGQTGLMGLTAGLLALPVGTLLAALMVYVINRRSFGWRLHLALDPGVLAEAVLLALAAALLAGLYPAWKMARTRPAVALREE